jgi:hypothetical protein
LNLMKPYILFGKKQARFSIYVKIWGCLGVPGLQGLDSLGPSSRKINYVWSNIFNLAQVKLPTDLTPSSHKQLLIV